MRTQFERSRLNRRSLYQDGVSSADMRTGKREDQSTDAGMSSGDKGSRDLVVLEGEGGEDASAPTVD